MTNKIILIGAPLSGKGTLCEYLLTGSVTRSNFSVTNPNFDENYKSFIHISSGDICRSMKFEETKKGELVPDTVFLGLLKNIINENKDKNIICDGFPRTKEQMQCMIENNFFSDSNVKVFYIHVDENLLYERITLRQKTLESKNEVRDDDNIEVLKNRIKIFNENLPELLDLFGNYSDYENNTGMQFIDIENNKVGSMLEYLNEHPNLLVF